MRKSFSRLVTFLSLLVVIGSNGDPLATAAQTSDATTLYFPLILNTNPVPRVSTWIGPGGGAITDLIFDPLTPNKVFAAAMGGGVYKSTDGGLTWRNVSPGLGSLDITAVEVSPMNPLILYAGSYQGGLFKSVNNGESWYSYGTGIQNGAITYAIEIDPTRSKRIYLATRGYSNDGAAPWNGVVYKSEDGGALWQPVLTNAGGSGEEDWAYDLAIHPKSTNVVYAATHEHGAYRSQDYGATWGAINAGVSDLTGRAIEPDPNASYPGPVYLGVFHRTGIFKSLNGGDGWTLYNQNIAEARIYKLSIDPENPNTLYLATFDHGVMKSTNGGLNWSAVGMSAEILLDVVVQPGSPQNLLTATIDNGLFRSTIGGGNWVHSQSGLNATTVTSALVQPGDPNQLVASLAPGWIARSTNGGQTWTDYHTGINDKTVHALVRHPAQPNLLYALTESAGLYRRDTLSGEAWQSIGNNLPAGASETAALQAFSRPEEDLFAALFPGAAEPNALATATSEASPLLSLVFAPTSPLTAFLGTGGAGVYKSSDGGLNWSPTGLSGRVVSSLAIAPQDPARVYAAAGPVYLSTNGGVSWTDLALPAGSAYALAAANTQAEWLYVGTSSGVYRYEGSWQACGLAGYAVQALAVHPANPNLVYAGTEAGAFISSDGGVSWEPGPSELEGVRIRSIDFDPNDYQRVFFGTQAHGILLLAP
ncbi:MAG: hypothetical protein MUO62_11800 [Anaerolineales bacterium]|nr:hypothetical protein [Anaerolineales bacterium]